LLDPPLGQMKAFELFAVFSLAFVIAFLVMRPIRRIAVLRRVLDFPDDERRRHHRPVPRLGGIAVFVGFVVAVVAGVIYQSSAPFREVPSLVHTMQLLGACAILFGIGLADDIRGLPPFAKLVGQTAAALIVQYHWPLLPAVNFPPDITVHLGWLGVPIMTVWLVGVSNAFNLVDGLDGLAGGVGVIALLVITASALVLAPAAVPISSVALAGALVGFLWYNFPPASIFLGDSGSLVAGFLLAFLSVRRASRPDGAVLVILPVFALAYPLLDTGLAMLRRWLRGDPLSRADGRHVHHQLVLLGLDGRKAIGVIYLFSAAIGALGLSVVFAPPAFTLGIAATGTVVLAWIFAYGVRWLEYHEFIDAGAILGRAGSLARRAIRDAISSRDVANLIEKAETLEEIDRILGAHAETFRFVHIQVGPCDSRLPAIAGRTTKSLWKFEYPVGLPTPSGFHSSGGLDESLVLTIWCSKASTVKPASAERVATIISDAIAQWTVSASEDVGHQIRKRALTPAYSAAPPLGLRVSGDHAKVAL
jgi:UDP-GlcNAc:undecaprenyl-phosphate/decaprenyl-phosphate GlcNAc-1-phosphate transferase